MEIRTLAHNDLRYLLCLPRGFDEVRRYKTILYLHGAGMRGDDINMLRSAIIVQRYQEQDPADYILAAPQCPADTWFELFERLIALADHIRRLPYTNGSRYYLTGNSMGGYTSWQLAMTRPEWFAALAPVCGGGMYWNAQRLKDVPVWAFHGLLDPVIGVEESVKMVRAVNQAGGNARLTVYPHHEHDCWTPAYQDGRLYDWLFSHQKLGLDFSQSLS